MPKDFIKINTADTNAKFATQLKTWIDQVRDVIDQGDKFKEIMDHNVNHPDYADIETVFGLPVGNGDEVYNLVSGTIAGIKGTAQSADALTLISRVG